MVCAGVGISQGASYDGVSATMPGGGGGGGEGGGGDGAKVFVCFFYFDVHGV